MMKQNLGKLILLVLFSINLFASSVTLRVAAPAVYKGEPASFTISANGNDVEFPNITSVNGYRIIGISNGSSTTIINGKYDQKLTRTYTFTPTKDVIIPSYSVKVNGKEYKTQTQKISVLQPTQSKAGDDFVVELKLDKKELKVGESTKLKILFKQHLNAQADKLTLSEPKLENFWVKKIDNPKQYTQGNYIVQEFDYLIFAQKSGTFTINPVEASIGKMIRRSMGDDFFNDPFFNSIASQIKWKNIYSNSLTITVDKLPQNLELYGDFNIHAKVDTTTVNANKPVNFTILIDGIGNIDDIKKFDITIPNIVTYPDKPQINSQLINGKYTGAFVQKIVFIANQDFTIPSVKLTYFDSVTQKVKTIKTKPIDIKVTGGLVTQAQPKVESAVPNLIPTQKEKKTTQKTIIQNSNTQYIFLIVGLVLGIFITYIMMNKKSTNKKDTQNDIINQIKNTKDDKKLFQILLPYAKEHKDIDDILNLLEENIYKQTNHKIDKQKLYDIFL